MDTLGEECQMGVAEGIHPKERSESENYSCYSIVTVIPLSRRLFSERSSGIRMDRSSHISTQNHEGTRLPASEPSSDGALSSTYRGAVSPKVGSNGQADHSNISVTLAGERIARLDAIIAGRWAALHEISGSVDQTAEAVAAGPAVVQDGSATEAELAAEVDQPSATVAVVPPAGVMAAASPAKIGQLRGGIPARPQTRFSEVLQRRGRKVPFPILNPVSAP